MNTPQLSFYDIAPSVRAFSSMRHGGVSTGNYGEFNVNAYCGDDANHVAENRKALCQTLGIDIQRLVMPHQTHGIESRIIADDFFNLPQNIREMLLQGVDCVMTNQKATCIGVSTADCIPILLYDPENNAAAAVHAGWRGTVAQIALKAANDMRMTYATKPTQLKAVIGPGISQDAFEVGEEVYEQFASANFDMPAISRQQLSADGKTLKWHIDLWQCNRLQLEAAGILPENIFVSGICTYNNSADWFSARRLSINSGRIFTGIIID